MTPLFPARRAAEEFAGVIEGSRTDVADRYADLTATIDLLREQPAVEARADFVADLRSRLMTAAETVLEPASPARPAAREAVVVPLPTRRHRLGTAAAAALVVVGGTAGMAVASHNALPGDTLYPVKRGLESAQAQFSLNDASRGSDLLGQAATRLGEVGALSNDKASAETIAATLQAFQDSANHGSELLFKSFQADGDSSQVAEVRDFTHQQMADLAVIAAAAPPSNRDDFAEAADTLAAIDTQARTLCAGCGGEAIQPPDGLTTSSDLATLVAAPTRGAAHDASVRRQQSALAAAAEQASGSVATGASSDPAAPAAPVTQSSKPGVTVPTTSDPVGTVITQSTDGVTGLLDQVTKSTGGLTQPLTDPLNDTLDTLGGSVGTLLP